MMKNAVQRLFADIIDWFGVKILLMFDCSSFVFIGLTIHSHLILTLDAHPLGVHLPIDIFRDDVRT